MNIQSRNKLISYSALAANFIYLQEIAGQVYFNDIDPDTVLEFNGDDYLLDMDNDGAADFWFTKASFFTTSSWWMSETAFSNNIEVQGIGINDKIAASNFLTGLCSSCSTSFTAPYALNTNVMINGSDFNFYYQGNMAFIENDYFGGGGAGNWFPDTEDKFLGLRFSDGEGLLHYGWVRCSVVDDYKLIIKDYAYEATPETPIETVFTFGNITWNFVKDGDITGTGDDLHFGFNAPADESNISAYRIICVKDAFADDFTIEDAELLSADQYIEIPAVGSDEYISSFNSLSLDSDGDLVGNGINYRLFILQKMNVGFADSLSLPSGIIILSDSTAAGIISLNDLYNYGTGLDLKLNFTSPVNKKGILGYRVMLVKEESLPGFTTTTALNVLPGNYYNVSSATESVSFPAGATARDSDGDVITVGKYVAVSLSVADSISAAYSVLSIPTPVETIEIETPVPSDLVLEDISDFGDGKDLQLSFDVPIVEKAVSEYRIYFMEPGGLAVGFNVDDALLIPPSNYYTVLPIGENIVFNGDENLTEIDGEIVETGGPYFAYVLIIANEFGTVDQLSERSNDVDLESLVSVDNPVNFSPLITYSDGNIFVNLNQEYGDPMDFYLYDISGRKICSGVITSKEKYIPVSLTSGIYIFSLFQGEKEFTVKLIVPD
jgi:hypothetical protein